jgi:hypothetical protein
MFVPSKYFSTRMRPTLKPFARACASSSVTSPLISICEVGGRSRARRRGGGGRRSSADRPDDVAAHRVEGDLVVAHDDEAEGERDGREHPALARGDRVDGDELRLDDVLQVGDLLVEPVVVIDQPVAVVLDPDVVLHRERHRRPRVRLELRAVDEEVGLGDGLGREHVVAQAPRVRQRDLDLRHLLEVVALHAPVRSTSGSTRRPRRPARRHGDAAALAHRELGHLAACAVAQAAAPPPELGARERVREQRRRRPPGWA